jgi:hypothetical protein
MSAILTLDALSVFRIGSTTYGLTITADEAFNLPAGGGATAVTLTGPSSGLVSVASTNFTVGANGTITGTVTVTPNDSGGGGTFTPTSVNISAGSPTATFTYTPASVGTKSIAVTNSGGLSNPSPLSYVVTSGAATAITITGPSSGYVGVPSSAFTIGANGTISGTITVTPSDSGGGGTFSPTSVSISSGSPTATFTYTPASSGTKSISVTNTGGLSNPSALSYNALVVGTTPCFRIIHTNHHATATLTATTSAASFPATDTQSTARDEAWRSTALGSQVISGVLPATKQASALFIGKHLCQGGTVKLELFSDAGFSTPASGFAGFGPVSIAQSIAVPNTWGDTPGDVLDTDASYYAQEFCYWFGTMVAFRSYKITFAGTPTNGSGYFEVGHIYLGPHLESPYMPEWNFELDVLDSGSGEVRSGGGTDRANAGATWKVLTTDVSWITPAYRPTFLDLMTRLQRSGDVVFSMFPNAGGRDERDYTIAGRFSAGGGIKWASVNRRAKRFILREN